MSDPVTIDVKGLRDVEDRMILLGSLSGEKVMRATLFVAVKPILDQAVANIAAIPTGSGALAKATRRVYLRPSVNSSLSSSGSRFTVAVAPKVKDRTAIALANLVYRRRKPIRGIFWGHLVEWGFTHRGSGRRIPGRLVFTRAIQSKAREAIEIFTKRIGVAVDRALKKQNP